MRHVWVVIGMLVALVYVASGLWHPLASEAEVRTQPATLAVAADDTAPTLDAAAYAVIDMTTGALLFTENATTPQPIASVTKLFTAVAVYDTYELSAPVTIEAVDVKTYGSAGKLQAEQSYTARELLFPLLLSSSNDAAHALRRQGGNDTLLAAMEAVARRGGASGARFADASGLAAGNEASAQGLAMWLQSSFASHKAVYDMTRVTQYVGPYLGWQNNSPFLAMDGYRGGKHGYTPAAGRTAAVVFTEEVDGVSRELGYVVLGSTDLADDVASLRTHVQRSVEWR